MSEVEDLPANAHAEAAVAFGERVRDQYEPTLVECGIFGSTVRGEAHGRGSDVDVFIVLDGDADDGTANSLRDIAFDVMLDYGPVVELHILTESTFERYKREGNPFVERALAELQDPQTLQ